MAISKQLFGNKYGAEAPFSVVACPRELTTTGISEDLISQGKFEVVDITKTVSKANQFKLLKK